jgi:PKD repeat protein
MKKIFTLLWLTLAAFTFKATAQGTTCNAEFSVQYITNYTVKFNPVTTTDSPYVHHYWSFGDGSTGSQLISPTHTYLLPGNYAAVHTIVRLTPNNVPVCTQSFTKIVTITEPCNLVADFSWSSTAANPLTVAFQNLSVPLAATDSVTWIFGDNTANSHAVNAVHTYANAGSYNVCLIVKKNNNNTSTPCIRYICKTVVVQAPPCTLVADFNWTVTQTNPLRIEFHNLSTPLSTTDSIRWTFGDGTSSTDVNPIHTYNVAGTYIVCLRVKKLTPPGAPPCVREICKTIVVTAPCNMVPNFTWTVTSGNPLRIEFQNTSTNTAATDSIRWTFGDGSSSNQINPVHTYNAAGTYTVCLRIIRYNAGSNTPCIREICKTIVVTAPCNMIPDFTWTATAANPLSIEFHNTSTNTVATDSIRWTFGDGSSSNQLNPVHTYATAGTYTVCLRIIRYNAGTTTPCVREICKTVVIPPLCTLVADFSSQPDSGNTLRIKFTNLSVPVTATDSLFWNFGDGTTLSGVQGNPNVANPTHNYANAGNYNVCLVVKKYPTTTNNPCIKYTCKNIVVFAPCTLVVNFTSQPDPNHPLRIKFTNTSTPIAITDSVRWTFGDGTSVSGLQSDPNVANPTHDYANAGTYTVCLRVKKNGNSQTPVNCVREKCSTVVVTPPCNFVVHFSWRLDSINVKKVYFTNLTTPPTANAVAVWNFGDGTTATSWNAVHEYAQPGQYRVCLRVYSGTNTTCYRESCDTVVIPVPLPPCTELSKYHYESFPNDNQKYKFTPDYINTTFQYTWTFGDGTGSHDPIATHRYAQPGLYVACLTVWRNNTCASATCKEIHVLPQINCDTAHAGYTYQRNPNVPNRIQFFANATLPILDQVWTITKVGSTTTPVILHENNPVYLFQDTGYFRVCLKATLQGGCVKEYCNYIYIKQVSSACELQAFPNPANASVNVNVYLTQPVVIHAYVYNSLNVLMLQHDQQGNTGNNLVTLNISSLAAGQYTIRLIYGNRVCYARFQKL